MTSSLQDMLLDLYKEKIFYGIHKRSSEDVVLDEIWAAANLNRFVQVTCKRESFTGILTDVTPASSTREGHEPCEIEFQIAPMNYKRICITPACQYFVSVIDPLKWAEHFIKD